MFKKILSLACCVAIMTSLAACGEKKTTEVKESDTAQTVSTDESKDTENNSSEDTIDIVFIPKSDSAYWENMYSYVEKTCSDIDNVSISKANISGDDILNKQIKAIQDCVQQGVDGIILGANDTDGLIPAINEARTADVPVVLVDSGINGDGYDAFLSTNNVQAGVEVAKAMCEAIGDAGEVVIMSGDKASGSAQQRSEGFRKELENHPNVTVVEEYFCESDRELAKTQVIEALSKYPNAKGFFGGSTSSSIGMMNGIKEAGAIDKILITFDNAEEVKAGLADGSVYATAMQMPSSMATGAVHNIIDLCSGKMIKSKDIDTGVVIITKDNYTNEDMQAILNQ